MLTVATAAIFVTMIICNYKRDAKELADEKETITIDLSLMLAAMIGDVILACILF